MRTRSTPKQNHLLAALPAADFARLAPQLELVPLALGAVIYESDGEQAHVYFPASGIVSLLYVMNDGAAAEIAVVGNEGMVGISLFMGGGSTPSRAVVQSVGKAYRLDAAQIKLEFARGGALQRLLLSLDRLPSSELVMTQQLIANMLGVRREGVTEAAGRLQADGVISYRRGR